MGFAATLSANYLSVDNFRGIARRADGGENAKEAGMPVKTLRVDFNKYTCTTGIR